MKTYALFVLLLLLSFSGCTQPVPIDNIKTPPTTLKADKVHADVFKLLDGTWEGNFQIFEDSKPRSITKVDLQNLTLGQMNRLKLKKINEIQVKQVYTSESPYFQRVTITDYYPDTDKTEVSEGVNKIQNGKMWCVVHKPTEVIIHEGATKDANTIIWYSKKQSPQKIEYFQETVTKRSYEIIGYGYYDGDDTNLSPGLWFYGKYEKK